MKGFLKILSFMALGLTFVPSIIVLVGKLDVDVYKTMMILGMVLWFFTAPFWIFERKSNA